MQLSNLSKPKNIARLIILIMLSIAPLAIGSVHPSIIYLYTVISVTLLFYVQFTITSTWHFPKYLAYVFIVIIAVTLIQLIPLPLTWHAYLQPSTYHKLSYVLASPINSIENIWAQLHLAPHWGWFSIVKISFYAILLLLLLQLFKVHRRDYLLYSISIVGFISFWIALIHTITDAQKILGFYEIQQTQAYPFMGTFVNTNFQAGFWGICGFVSLGLYSSSETKNSLKTFFALTSIAAFIGVYITLSRAAMILLPLMLAFYWLFSRNLATSKKISWLIIITLWITAVSYLVASQVGQELLSLIPWHTDSDYSKLSLWPIMVSIARDFWIIGIGVNSFATVFGSYAPAMATVSTFWSGENELLQILVNYGLIAGSVILYFLIRFIFQTVPRHVHIRPKRLAVYCALLFIGLQNLLDYSLSSAGIMIPVLALISWLIARHSSTRQVTWLTINKKAIAGFAIFVTVIGAASLWFYPKNLHQLSSDNHIATDIQKQFPLDYYYYALQAKQELQDPHKPLSQKKVIYYVNRSLFCLPNNWFAHFIAGQYFLESQNQSQALLHLSKAFMHAPSEAKKHHIISIITAFPQANTIIAAMGMRHHALQLELLKHLQGSGNHMNEYQLLKQWTNEDYNHYPPEQKDLVANILVRYNHMDALKNLLDDNPEASWHAYYQGIFYTQQGRQTCQQKETECKSWFLKAIASFESIPIGRFSNSATIRLSQLYTYTDNLEKLNQLILRAPATLRAQLYYYRGAYLLKHKSLDQGLTDLNVAMQLKPHWEAPLLLQAQTWMQQQKYHLAIHTFEKILHFKPDNTKAKQGIQRAKQLQKQEQQKNFNHRLTNSL